MRIWKDLLDIFTAVEELITKDLQKAMGNFAGEMVVNCWSRV